MSDVFLADFTEFGSGVMGFSAIADGGGKILRAVKSSGVGTVAKGLYNHIMPDLDDPEVFGKVRLFWGTSTQNGMVGYIIRFTDTNNYYYAGIYRNANIREFRVYKKVAGITTLLSMSPGGWSNNVWTYQRFRVVGNQLELSSSTDGVTYTVRCLVRDTSHTTGKTGHHTEGYNTSETLDYDDTVCKDAI